MVGSDKTKNTSEAILGLEQEIQKLDLESEIRSLEVDGDKLSLVDTLDDQEILTAEPTGETTYENEALIQFKLKKENTDISTIQSVSKTFGEQLNISIGENSFKIQAPESIAAPVFGRLGGLTVNKSQPPQPNYVQGIRERRTWNRVSRLADKWKKAGLTGQDRAHLAFLIEGASRRGTPYDEVMSPLHWLNPGLMHYQTKHLLSDYEKLEKSYTARKSRLTEIEKIPKEEITEIEKKELKGLLDEEIQREWLKNILKTRLSNEKLNEISYENKGEVVHTGFRDKTYGSKRKYLRITQWDLIDEKSRRGALWNYDNALLRLRNKMAGKPRKSELWWVKQAIKGDAESLFDDVDEEIYAWKSFTENVKSRNKELDDLEEEVTGFDRFTVEEETEIKRMVSDELKSMKQYEEVLRDT